MTTTTQFHVLLTQQGQTPFDGQANEVDLPGTDGQFGVLLDHQETVAALTKGEVRIVSPNSELNFHIEEGLAHIGMNSENVFEVSIVAQGVEPIRQEGVVFRGVEAEAA